VRYIGPTANSSNRVSPDEGSRPIVPKGGIEGSTHPAAAFSWNDSPQPDLHTGGRRGFCPSLGWREIYRAKQGGRCIGR